MSRQSISFTLPNADWLNKKVNVEHEYKSNSEAVNDLIRKARDVEQILARSCPCNIARDSAALSDDNAGDRRYLGNVRRV